MTSKTEAPPLLVNKHDAASAIGVSPHTLRVYRKEMIEGIHFHYWNSRTIRYDLECIKHWALHRNDPKNHQKWLDKRLQNKGTSSSRFPAA